MQEGQQLSRFQRVKGQVFQGLFQRHVVAQGHQLAGDAGVLGMVREFFPALGLHDLAGPGQQGVEVAIFVDELGRGLDADAGHAGDVVGGVSG